MGSQFQLTKILIVKRLLSPLRGSVPRLRVPRMRERQGAKWKVWNRKIHPILPRISKHTVQAGCPKWGWEVSKMRESSVQNTGVIHRWQMNTDVKTGKHYAQGVSNVSELLSKILKEISLCLRAFVREMVLTVLHKCVQNECAKQS